MDSETFRTFSNWFYSEPHRAKYTPSDPAFLAARETWGKLETVAKEAFEKQRVELDTLKKELDTERMRLVACGVVARADTPESAVRERAMHPAYMSESCRDVARRVDECIQLREQVAILLKICDRTQAQARQVMARLLDGPTA